VELRKNGQGKLRRTAEKKSHPSRSHGKTRKVKEEIHPPVLESDLMDVKEMFPSIR
jgi:hypothetical protein